MHLGRHTSGAARGTHTRHTSIHTRKYAHIQTHIQAHIHAHMHTYKHTYNHTYNHIRNNRRERQALSVQNTLAQPDAFGQTRIHVYPYIQAHIQAHTQKWEGKTGVIRPKYSGTARCIWADTHTCIPIHTSTHMQKWEGKARTGEASSLVIL